MVFTSCVQPQKDELRPSESGEDINDVSDTDNLTGAILEAWCEDKFHSANGISLPRK